KQLGTKSSLILKNTAATSINITGGILFHTMTISVGETDDSYNDDVDRSYVLETSSSGFYSAYEAKEVLGRGLASTVRKCVEKGTGLMFAVKIVDISTERQSEQEATRLLNETISEVNLLRQLAGHPSIINIHDFYETPTFLFAVFEMAPNGELFEMLNKSVTVSEKKARRLMRQLFDGVAFMHERNIVHRDLKSQLEVGLQPVIKLINTLILFMNKMSRWDEMANCTDKLENILCIDDERVVISDFGFATQLQPGQKLKELLGTPGYLAPETLRCQMYEDAEGYGVEVDDWALGVIFYTLLAGYAPFYHRRQLIMLRMIQEAKFEFRAEQWAQITYDAKDLINKILVVDVSKRYTAAMCLRHPWMLASAATKVAAARVRGETIAKRDYRHLWQHSIILVRFFIRLTNIKYLKLLVDRNELRQRPFRDRDIRHESEAAVFAVYGHWVNRGFFYSRDMLFANKPRPKYRRMEVEACA
ncbi:Phosphorylase b kinase gamma catalytic chain, liver/testis isoform, partial [Toxocara canis]